MSDAPQGPGWWQASDGRWYPPAAGTPAPPPASTPAPLGGTPAPPPGPGAGEATQAQALAPAGGYGPPTGPPGPPGAFGPPTGPPGGFGPGAGGFPSPGPPKKGSGNGLYVVLALVAFVAIAGTAVFFAVSGGGGDDDEAGPDTTEADVTERLQLLQADDVGPDAFGAAFQSDRLPELANEARQAAEDVRSSLSAGPADALVAPGSTERLHSGSRTDQVCDPMGVADFLESDAERAPAFAGVLGIGAGDVRDYLTGLTPVILANDTWVTDHGYLDGRATTFSAVLQAGTAVLVDGVGVPRVRCPSGDPLTAPDRSGRSPTATDGDRWDDYEPAEVVVVEPGDELQTLTLIEAESGEEFSRGLGAGQTGDVQVTLQWTSDADLDLHVVDPDGFEVSFADRTSDSGGELDVDVIPGCDGSTETRTENVFWPSDEAPSGGYRAWVESFDSCGAESQELDIQIVVGGEVVVSETTTVAADDQTPDYTFEV